jgi:dTMP kinase
VTLFITFEGPEGSGKTTQIRTLADALAGQNVPVVTTREPGGTRIGNGVRALLLDPAHREMSVRAEALLFNAARAQLVDEVIRPALAAGSVVLCDRYADSTLAYQGYGHGQDLDALRRLIRFATGGLQPDLTVYLDIEARLGLERKQPGEWNRMEAHALAFHEAVRAGYLALAAAAPERWLVVAATQPQEAIGQAIFARVAAMLAAGMRAANGESH